MVKSIFFNCFLHILISAEKQEFETTSTTCINDCYKLGHIHCINSMFNKGVCCAYDDEKL